jgi:hypothetical protein
MSLRVQNSGLPLADLAVVFHDADGEVLGQTTTDADGVASGEVAEGGMVTVIGGTTRLTVAGVEPGDDLVLGYPRIAIPEPNHRPSSPTSRCRRPGRRTVSTGAVG